MYNLIFNIINLFLPITIYVLYIRAVVQINNEHSCDTNIKNILESKPLKLNFKPKRNKTIKITLILFITYIALALINIGYQAIKEHSSTAMFITCLILATINIIMIILPVIYIKETIIEASSIQQLNELFYKIAKREELEDLGTSMTSSYRFLNAGTENKTIYIAYDDEIFGQITSKREMVITIEELEKQTKGDYQSILHFIKTGELKKKTNKELIKKLIKEGNKNN